MAKKQWRVVSRSRRGFFEVFGESEDAARRTMDFGILSFHGNVGPLRLESRPAGMSGNDETWQEEKHEVSQ